jgi:RND family efflux transporter MFP subunit
MKMHFSPHSPRFTQRTRRLSFCLSAVLGLFAGCGGPPPRLEPPKPPVVTVEYPVVRTLDSLGEYTGRLQAIESQVVMADVTGYIKEIKFKEGAIVKEGDPLYVIDPEPFAAALAAADANISKAQSDIDTQQKRLELAQGNFDRAKPLYERNQISRQEFDEAVTALETARTQLGAATATLQAAQAARRTAQFNLDNSTVKSKVTIPGRISRTEVTVGNLVISGQTVLSKITSLDPIHAYWFVDEETSLAYRRKIYDEKSLPDPRGERKLACWVGLRDESKDTLGKWPHLGEVDYIAPEIIRSSGTREIRGVIPNPDFRLSPGDSVRVQVVAGPSQEQLTIPEIAVGSQQQHKFVYVIVEKDGKSIAEFRPVLLGPVRELQGVRLQVIRSGITEKDKIVVNGLLRVRPGAEVQATIQQSPVGGLNN